MQIIVKRFTNSKSNSEKRSVKLVVLCNVTTEDLHLSFKTLSYAGAFSGCMLIDGMVGAGIGRAKGGVAYSIKKEFVDTICKRTHFQKKEG